MGCYNSTRYKILGYYRKEYVSDGIYLSDGRREMADLEFGAGANAEKVIHSSPECSMH